MKIGTFEAWICSRCGKVVIYPADYKATSIKDELLFGKNQFNVGFSVPFSENPGEGTQNHMLCAECAKEYYMLIHDFLTIKED